MMELKDIATITGKGGLFKIVKPTRNGVIVETLDDQKKKIVVAGNARVSILNDVSIYTTDSEGSIPLEKVFQKINNEFGDDLGIESSSDIQEMKAFIKHTVPNYDEERVYPSDIKKLVNWYKILLKQAPEVLLEKKENKEGNSEEVNEKES